jgi:hypothetical protein
MVGSPALNDYIIQYSSDSGSNWTTFTDTVSTATSVTVTGLTNGTAYIFRVAGKNNIGTGTYSVASNSVTPLFGKVPTPIIGDIAETTSTITWCYTNYFSDGLEQVGNGGTATYNYYNFTPGQPPNDQNGSCHGWTGIGENVNRYTYVYVSKPGWANSDAAYAEETTNVTPPPAPISVPTPIGAPIDVPAPCADCCGIDGVCIGPCCGYCAGVKAPYLSCI